jgi:hypothetical protein
VSDKLKNFLRRVEKEVAALPPVEADGATPQEGLLQAAQSGGFEALVRAARPAQPVAMVTPEEREAELRQAGQGPDGTGEAREPEREPTPNEQYIAQHCRWRRRGPNDYRERHRPGRCLTEYDPISGEVIGDGYCHDDESDEW